MLYEGRLRDAEAELAAVTGAGEPVGNTLTNELVPLVADVADPDGDQAHVTNVVVDPDRRREGIATRLMLALAEQAIGRGCVAWTLEVRASSEGAQELYRRFGFAPAGVRKRYYENVEDAIVMWCHDIDGADYAARLEELA